jgi:phosphatidylglycerophosphatase A
MSGALEDGEPGVVRPGATADLRFLLAHPAHAIALGLGSGLLRPGPGTWGTALSWAIFLVLVPEGTSQLLVALPLLLIALLAGTWATKRTAAQLGQQDPSVIVVDEMVAFWLVLVLLAPLRMAGANALAWQALAFVLFRFFDIVKPPPIRAIDRRWKNAAGVMADDLMAAFYTLLVLAIARSLT